jgi:hypothetical protein
MLQTPERDLLVESVLIADPGFPIVLFEAAPASLRPPRLIEMHVPDAAKGRFGRVGVFVVFGFRLAPVQPAI